MCVGIKGKVLPQVFFLRTNHFDFGNMESQCYSGLSEQCGLPGQSASGMLLSLTQGWECKNRLLHLNLYVGGGY